MVGSSPGVARGRGGTTPRGRSPKSGNGLQQHVIEDSGGHLIAHQGAIYLNSRSERQGIRQVWPVGGGDHTKGQESMHESSAKAQAQAQAQAQALNLNLI